MSVIKEQDTDYQKFGDFTFVSCGMEHSDDEEFPHAVAEGVEEEENVKEDRSNKIAIEHGSGKCVSKVVCNSLCDVCIECQLSELIGTEGSSKVQRLWKNGDGNNSIVPNGNNIISFDTYLERTEVIVVDVTARCKFCDKNIDCECYVSQPEQPLSEVRHYTCRTCKKLFVCYSDLKLYPSFYNVEKGYQCDICSKIVSKTNNVKCRNFYCQICDKTFIQLKNFIKHNLIHSGGRMYMCDVCDKNFNVLDHLLDHKLNHVNSEMCTFEICIKSVDDLPSDEKGAVLFFQKVGVLPPKRICQRGHDMKLYFGEKLKTRWYCNIRTCRTKINMRVGNWLEGSKLPFLTALRFIYYWTKELTSVEWCRRQLDVANSTTVDWNNYLREVCVAAVEKQSVQKIGGKKTSIEVNLSMFSRQKSHNEYGSLQQWIFGGICRETNDCFLVQIPDRSLQTVVSAIIQHIEDGSTIYSDLWTSYYTSACNDSFEALKRNCNYNFIDYETETHTETLERLWGSDKWRSKKHRGIARHLLGSYLAEFLWRQQLKGRDPFETILQCIKDFRPPEIVCKSKEHI